MTMQAFSDYPIAYLITFHTYGTWLHGVGKGSVDRDHNQYESEFLEANRHRYESARSRMTNSAILLSKPQREVVRRTIYEVADHRGWRVRAENVRTNHVHVVVEAECKPEKVMNDLKAYATRMIRKANLLDGSTKLWARHGSTRYLWDLRAVDAACHYVIEGQGVDLNDELPEELAKQSHDR